MSKSPCGFAQTKTKKNLPEKGDFFLISTDRLKGKVKMSLEEFNQDGALNLVGELLNEDFYAYFEDRMERSLPPLEEKEWVIETHNLYHTLDVRNIIRKVVFLTASKPEITAQQILGLFWNKIQATKQHRKNMVCKAVLTGLFDGYYFNVSYTDEAWFVTSNIIDDRLKDIVKKVGFPLPHLEKPKKVSPYNIGYENSERIVCGGSYNPVHYDLALDHINRVNSVKFHWDSRILQKLPMTFDSEPKLKMDHTWETPAEVEERRKGFALLKESMRKRIPLLQGEDFYLSHKYDKRGRCYAKAYEFNYMGTKGIKASVQFSKKEEIND